ncbi:MAG: HD domain-containing protein [Lachnospiraceae bacterium]|jgi:exopolyphosphatase/guanosine-5'-triphosphate,3'-diphosphate pyrophosphatase|nr:HD domain-containing protein [Lachnospiraceae bacterium]
MKTFAAIDAGSFELSMKIFEISPKSGMHEIDHIRHRIDLGTETYATGKMAYERVDELCRYLNEFTKIMKGYKVSEYKAYGTSAIRETENTAIILDQIRQRTGINVEVLSNSEQRFLGYKAIAFKGEAFNKFIEKGTAIVDIGGGSIQISLFDKDKLVATQNMRLGVLRLREILSHLDVGKAQYDAILTEMISSQLSVFKKLYLKDRQITNIIVVDDYINALVQKKFFSDKVGEHVDVKTFQKLMKLAGEKTSQELTRIFDMPQESIDLLYISYVLLKRIIEVMNAEMLWAPGMTLCDGMAYEYAQENKIVLPEHDFEQDIIACAQNISKRYMGSKKRGETLEKIALTIFDSMKKVHGLGQRDRLLLRLATLLHDCGKYISMTNLGECSYSIIMATEIIGLSHMEREIVANVVKFNHEEFEYYDVSKASTLDQESYLRIAKLTAILRVANGLDRSHKQKFKDVKTILKDDVLTITVDTKEDITLEKGMFSHRADFFEEVYSVKPVIKQKRSL